MTELARRRRGIIGSKKKKTDYIVRLQSNTVVFAEILDQNKIAVTSWPASGNNQIQYHNSKGLNLNQGDTLSIKLYPVSGNGAGYYSCFFWAHPTGESDTAYYLFNNTFNPFRGGEYSFSANSDISGKTIVIRRHAENGNFNPAFTFYIELYKNGVLL